MVRRRFFSAFLRTMLRIARRTTRAQCLTLRDASKTPLGDKGKAWA
jgi:hypothetical protein